MSSHDDPEARIRELERSLGERTTELTRSSAEPTLGRYDVPPALPYGAQLPPPAYGAQFPPPPYGAQFSSPAPPQKKGGPAWVVVGAAVGVLAAISVGAVVFFSNLFSSVEALIDVPTVSPVVPGGGGPFGAPSGANRPRPPAGEPSIAPPGVTVTVSGVGEDRTIECNDGDVSISGVSNVVELTGHCASVTISGIENVVTIDASDVIAASGLQNQVTYRSGSPDITNSGSSNSVERR